MTEAATRKYSGADWIRQQPYGEKISELGTAAADILGDAFLGIYHLPSTTLQRVEWSSDRMIAVAIWGEVATFDMSVLTRLVVLAHDRAVRIAIEPCNMRCLRLTFHPRSREGRQVWERHPSLEDHVAMLRAAFGDEVAA